MESNAKEGLSVFQRALHVPNAMRNLLIKISKLKNIGHTAASGLHAAMVGAFSNPDPSAANTPGCPASPRPVHATISDGSRGNGDNIEQSSQTAPLSPPGSVLGTDGTQDEGSQHPHPSLIFGNYGPPPGIAGVVHQAGNQSPRRLSPPPGFGPPFGSRRYPPGFRPPVMFEKCFSLASTRIVSCPCSHMLKALDMNVSSQLSSTTTHFLAIDAAVARILAGSTAAVITLTPDCLSLSKTVTRYVRDVAMAQANQKRKTKSN